MNFLVSDLKKNSPSWSQETLQTYRHSRGWPELSPAMAERVVAAIHDIQDHFDGQVVNSWAEPAFLFQPAVRKAKDNG